MKCVGETVRGCIWSDVWISVGQLVENDVWARIDEFTYNSNLDALRSTINDQLEFGELTNTSVDDRLIS